MRINLTDNHSSSLLQRKDVLPLFPVAGKTIATLCRDNENLLIFPYSSDSFEDRIGDSSIFSIENTDNPEQVRIRTGNVMGFIGMGGLKVKIKSRFDLRRDDYLLHYMLQKVFSFNLFDLCHDNEQEDVFDFIMLMFPYFLKTALRQGLYREYQTYRHNDANLRGIINVGRHIAKNVPFVGNFAYSKHEYSHDNSVMELIRHAIEFMRTKKYGHAVLSIDHETTENVKTVIEHTPLYNKKERRHVINVNLRNATHPYYTEYRPLQLLCLQILRMDEVKYGEIEDEICGILFDGAWLWEEYINTILRNYGFIHPQNKQGRGGIYLFDDNSGLRFPDFYREDMVLDAKYKQIRNYEKVSAMQPADIHQMVTYMVRLGAARGGFILPFQSQEKIPMARLKGRNETIAIFGIEISKVSSSFSSFCEEMKQFEANFVRTLAL